MQPVNGKRPLVYVRAHNLLELPFEIVHYHEGGIAMHQHAYTAGEPQRFRQHLQGRDRLGCHIGATEIIFLACGAI